MSVASLHKIPLTHKIRICSGFSTKWVNCLIGKPVRFVVASRKLGYMQLLDNDIPACNASFDLFVNVILRYPGLCRYTSW